MTEDEWLRTLSLADRLRIAAVDLALMGAGRALAAAVVARRRAAHQARP